LSKRYPCGLNNHIVTVSLFSVPVYIHTCTPEEFVSVLFKTTAAEKFLEYFNNDFSKTYKNEHEIFEAAGKPFIVPEMRNGHLEWEWVKRYNTEDLADVQNIKGIVHNHSTWSDGLNSIEEMAHYCIGMGMEYLIMSDHSVSAFYAQGLTTDRVLQQHREIDELNIKLAPFKIFKSIESDILSDGSLDYDEDILSLFDCVIASVHSGLNMDIDKATNRLLRAIQNPYTTILGHPTGRLLLSREGYPLHFEEIIDACAQHQVVIELNANPWRLDLDWEWVYYAMDKGVKISVNPDAHSVEGIHDIHYGILAARKGGLTKEFLFNAMHAAEMDVYLRKRKADKLQII
jgi:DNA polymerase (family 10)